MAAINITPTPQGYSIIHPLDDVAETKCSTTGLGPIRMTRAVRLSLTVLRAYLVLDPAGWLRHAH